MVNETIKPGEQRIISIDGTRSLGVFGYTDELAGKAHIHFYNGPDLLESNTPSIDAQIKWFDMEEFLAAVAALPGVTVTYDPPTPPVKVPQGIGAVIGWGPIRITKVNPDKWLQNLRVSYEYTDEQVAKYLSNGYEVLSEGVVENV